MDFKISVKYPVLKDLLSKALPDSGLYFAFTGRWGQYIGDRYSSPVIAKRFNPKLFGLKNSSIKSCARLRLSRSGDVFN